MTLFISGEKLSSYLAMLVSHTSIAQIMTYNGYDRTKEHLTEVIVWLLKNLVIVQFVCASPFAYLVEYFLYFFQLNIFSTITTTSSSATISPPNCRARTRTGRRRSPSQRDSGPSTCPESPST